jgi:hypothetical protein
MLYRSTMYGRKPIYVRHLLSVAASIIALLIFFYQLLWMEDISLEAKLWMTIFAILSIILRMASNRKKPRYWRLTLGISLIVLLLWVPEVLLARFIHLFF